MNNNDHSTHDSSKRPIEGCHECDREINRPIQRRFGNGSSSTVVNQNIDKEDGSK